MDGDKKEGVGFVEAWGFGRKKITDYLETADQNGKEYMIVYALNLLIHGVARKMGVEAPTSLDPAQDLYNKDPLYSKK